MSDITSNTQQHDQKPDTEDEASSQHGIGASMESAHLLVDDGILPNADKTQYEVSERSTILQPTEDGFWLPLTLRLPFLSFLFLVSIILTILVSALTAYSAANHGLKDNSDASTLLFGWRYSPTLVATIYALLVASMLNDVRRTEIFARLSRSESASATYTLCYPIRAWWNDPFDALSRRKNNGIRSWALWFASTSNILVLLIISPLSAGLLSPASLQISDTVLFRKASPAENLTWPLDSMDLIMFRTISGGIIKQPTSVWLSTEFAVLPVWPQYLQDVPLGSTLNVSVGPQEWTLPTTVYKAEVSCMAMTSAYKNNFTVNIPYPLGLDGPKSDAVNMTALYLKSDDGCIITITDIPAIYSMIDHVPWLLQGGGWWSNGPRYNSSILYGPSNSTRECGNRSMFFVKSAKSAQVEANLCELQYFSADIPVTVLLNQSSTQINVDSQRYLRNRRPLDHVKYNTSQLEKAFLDPSWSTKFATSSKAHYAGPMLAIAASPGYNNDPEAILQSSDLVQKATSMYQQFFGEMLLLELENRLDRSIDVDKGEITTTEQRIIVNVGVGITLGALLLVTTCGIGAVAYHSNLRRRSLHLYQDPGQIAVAASLVVADTNVRSALAGSGQLSKEALNHRLASSRFSMRRGVLIAVSAEDDSERREEVKPDESAPSGNLTPAILRTWMCSLLLIFLLVLLASIAAFYRISCTSGIHQVPFVYEFKTQIFDTAATLAPYSILPTLLAVGVKLWVAAVGETLKRFQPYITMATAPTPLVDSVLVEYLNAPVALVSFKAVKHSHWILAVAGLAALATEIFTVSISALWDLETKSLNRNVSISRQFELRQVPRIDEYILPYKAPPNADVQRYYVLSSVYSSALQSWLYSATLELTQQASTPPWSKDTWSFAPLDTDSLLLNETSLKDISLTNLMQARNVTLETLAVRARLECKPQSFVSNTSSWVEKIDFKNRTMWNTTNKPQNLDQGYILKGPANMGAGSEYLTCCGNETNGILGVAAVGYWSNLDYAASSSPSWAESWSYNQMAMNSKWIVGRPLDMLYQPNPNTTNNPALWIWLEEPQIAAITCSTILEKANASIDVATDTGVVYDYRILNSPVNATEAWLDKYLSHNTSIDYSGDMTYVGIDGEEPSLRGALRKNITTSWGYIFVDSVMNSGRAEDVSTTQWEPTTPENLGDHTFNFRIRGLNADFMSYSMLQMANNTKEALLDTDTLISLANRTFGVFFKHFASENITSSLGGNIYQPIGAKLPWSLGFVTNNTMYAKASDLPTTYQGALGIENRTAPTPRSATAILHIPVQQLVMSPTAVILCISLLAFLILSIPVIFLANRNSIKKLPRDVDTLASMLAFVYGSERLLNWVQERAEKPKPWYSGWAFGSKKAAQSHEMARMGSFETSDGKQLWGIELCESDRDDEETQSSPGQAMRLRSLARKVPNGDDSAGERGKFLGESDQEVSDEYGQRT